MMRGIRGAICAEDDTKQAIFEATSRLLEEVLARNGLDEDSIVSILLTTTPDLTADFPAYAIRGNGLAGVPVLCASEINVPGAMPKVIRMLVHAETELTRAQIKHVYLGDAARLRPDLS